MDTEERFWIWITGIIATGIVLIVLVLGVAYHNRMISMADRGYCETQGTGTATIFWQKCK